VLVCFSVHLLSSCIKHSVLSISSALTVEHGSHVAHVTLTNGHMRSHNYTFICYIFLISLGPLDDLFVPKTKLNIDKHAFSIAVPTI